MHGMHTRAVPGFFGVAVILLITALGVWLLCRTARPEPSACRGPSCLVLGERW